MIDSLMAAVSGANTALDMLKRGVDIRDQKIAEKAVADMTEILRAVTSNALDAVQDALRSAQEARSLDKRIVELEKEVAALRADAKERDLYQIAAQPEQVRIHSKITGGWSAAAPAGHDFPGLS